VTASASSWLQHHLLQLHGPVVYLVVGLLVFVEVGIVIGFFIPGEIATIIGGVIASQHHANVVLMIGVVAAAATVGNFSGYEIGKWVGPWLMNHKPLKGNSGAERAERLIARRGGLAVLIGRWIAVVRAILPGIAGFSGMHRRTFIVYSIIGGIAWATMWVLIGFAAGLSYTKIVNKAGSWSLVALGALAVGFVGFVVWRHLRDRSRRGSKGSKEGS
jgi:membrane-associated protein